MKLFFVILVIVLLVPVPIKITLKFFNKNFYLFVYNFQIDINKNLKKFTGKKKIKNEKTLKKIPIIKLVGKFNKNPIKPYYFFTLHMDYGFEDAAATSIFYGLVYTLYPWFYKFLSAFLNVKKYNFNIKPHFNKTLFNLEINSIFLLNIVNVIYIVILITSVFFNTKKINAD